MQICKAGRRHYSGWGSTYLQIKFFHAVFLLAEWHPVHNVGELNRKNDWRFVSFPVSKTPMISIYEIATHLPKSQFSKKCVVWYLIWFGNFIILQKIKTLTISSKGVSGKERFSERRFRLVTSQCLRSFLYRSIHKWKGLIAFERHESQHVLCILHYYLHQSAWLV